METIIDLDRVQDAAIRASVQLSADLERMTGQMMDGSCVIFDNGTVKITVRPIEEASA